MHSTLDGSSIQYNTISVTPVVNSTLLCSFLTERACRSTRCIVALPCTKLCNIVRAYWILYWTIAAIYIYYSTHVFYTTLQLALWKNPVTPHGPYWHPPVRNQTLLMYSTLHCSFFPRDANHSIRYIVTRSCTILYNTNTAYAFLVVHFTLHCRFLAGRLDR